MNEKLKAIGVNDTSTMPGGSLMDEKTAVGISTQKQHLSAIEAAGNSRQVG